MTESPRAPFFRRHRGILRFAVAASGLLLCLAILELGLGAMLPAAAAQPHMRAIRLLEHPPLTDVTLTPPPGSEGIPDRAFRMQVDEDGFIRPSRVHAKADFSIAFLGGSTTECMLVEENKRFPYLVGRLLEPFAGSVNSFNCGRAGANSLHSLNTLLNKALALHLDAAVMMHAGNDLAILLYEGSYWNRNPYRGPLFELDATRSTLSLGKELVQSVLPNTTAMLRKIMSGGIPEDAFAPQRGLERQINPAEIAADFEANLLSFVGLCRANDVTPVLMTQAHRLTDDPTAEIVHHAAKVERDLGLSYERYRSLWNLLNETTRKVAAAEQVVLVDLAGEVPATPEMMYDVCHYNTAGSTFVAELIAKELRRQGVVIKR